MEDEEIEIVIRKAKPADANSIAEHNVAMAMETENKILDRKITSTGVKAVFENPSHGFYLVAESEGEVIGNLMITIEWSDWRNQPMWWFQSVYIQAEYRGEGLFSRMFHEVKNMAQSAGASQLRLYVENENKLARKVYEKLGMVSSHYLMYEIEV